MRMHEKIYLLDVLLRFPWSNGPTQFLFSGLPLRLLRFLLFLLNLKVDGSINEGPFPSGKGQKLSRKDFQPVEGVMGVDRFAVGVRVISAPRD